MITTRKEYLRAYTMAYPDKAAAFKAHRDYFAQFVAPETIIEVAHRFGTRLIESIDQQYFNDIDIALWHSFSLRITLAITFGDAGTFGTESDYVCVAKEAARQWVEQQEVTE
jgi:hypothetical protein